MKIFKTRKDFSLIPCLTSPRKRVQEACLSARQQDGGVQGTWPAVRHHHAWVQLLGPGSIAMTWRVRMPGTTSTSCLPDGSWVINHVQILDLYFWSWQCSVSPSRPSYMSHLESSRFFVSRPGCVVKLQVEVPGSPRPAHLGADSTGFLGSPFFPFCVLLQRFQAIRSYQTEPLGCSSLQPSTWMLFPVHKRVLKPDGGSYFWEGKLFYEEVRIG